MKRLLRVARAEKDISQLELATRAGLSQKKVWGIENGYRLASLSERLAIAYALDMSIDAIKWPVMVTGKGGAHGH